MIKMKKLLMLAVCSVLMVVLVACNGDDDADGVYTLTFWTFGDSHAEYFEDAAAAWNELHPDRQIRLDISVLPFGQMHQNLQMALQSGSGAPDLVDVEIQQAGTFLNVDNIPFEPLNEEMAPFMNYLVYSRLDNFAVDGQYFGVDYHVGTMVMFYNVPVLEAAGINYRDIVTWQDFVEAGQVVVAQTGIYMTQVETSNAIHFEAMTAQQGQDYVTEDGRANFATPESIRALEMLHDMIYVYNIARPMVGGNIDDEQFYAEMAGGNLAALMAPAWYMGRFVNLMPDLSGDIAVAPIPVFNPGDNRSSSWGGTATMVTDQANHTELAREFVVWAKADYDQAIRQWTDLGFDPVRWDVWDSEVLLEENDFTIYFGTGIFEVLSDLQDETATVRLTAPNAPIIRDHFLVNVLPNVIAEPTLSPREALEAADEILNAELD